MKGKKIAKITAMMLAIAVCFLSACGGAENGKKQETATETAGQEGQAYQATFQDVSGVEGRFYQAELLGDTLYFTTAADLYMQQAGGALYRLENGEAKPVQLEDFDETKKISAISKDGKGNLKLAVASVAEPFTYEIRTVSAEGATIDSMDITSCLEDQVTAGISGMAVDSQGNAYIINASGLIVVDSTGKTVFKVPDVMALDIARNAEEKMILVYRADAGMQIKEVDLQNKTLVEAFSGIEAGMGCHLIKDMQGRLLYHSRNSVYEFEKETGSSEIFKFMENCINTAHIADMIQKENGDFLILTTEMDNDYGEPHMGGSQLVEVKLVDAATLPEKVDIVLGTYSMSSVIAKDIIAFNKKSDKYRIGIKEYMNADYDVQTALNQLNMDIITNKAPDIIDLTSIKNADLYMEKGLLEDLAPWMEQDEEVSGQTYLEPIMDVYRTDGKLYGIIPTFNIRSIVGKESVVGSAATWTVEDMMALAESTKEGQSLFAKDITKSSLLLNICLPANMDRFLNWKTGECRFNSEEFIKMMEFSNTYGSTMEEVSQYDWSKKDEEFRNGTRLLSVAYIANVLNVKYYEGLFGEEAVNFIGYPVNEGSGSKIVPGKAFAMMASVEAEKKEGAWQFIRQYLLKDYQENLGPIDGFPVMEEALLNHYEKAMTPEYQEDADGNQVEKPKMTEFILNAPYDVYAISQEDVDKIDSLIQGLDSLMKGEAQIDTIIEEEASAYFNGAKTAQEAAEIIQSRVQTYVNENK